MSFITQDKYEITPYERGKQYNDKVMYSITQLRGYNDNLPSDFFRSYSTLGITSSGYYRKKFY